METRKDAYRIGWWQNNLDALDRELARMAMLCRVKILEPGVVDRVMQGDESVCGTDNSLAFRKLHHLLLMHFLVRQKSAEATFRQKSSRSAPARTTSSFSRGIPREAMSSTKAGERQITRLERRYSLSSMYSKKR